MSCKIKIEETKVLEKDGWVSEYTVEAMGFKVQGKLLREALIILRTRVFNAFTEVINDA